MREVTYKDDRGRLFLVKIENDEPDENASYGIPIGPPDVVDQLGLPEDVATVLHNNLFNRKLWNYKEVQKRPNELLAALQAALSISVQKLHSAYADYGKEPDHENQEV